MKAEYWSDPASWQDIPGLDISIETVSATARSLLPRAIRRAPEVPLPLTPRADVFVSPLAMTRRVLPSHLPIRLAGTDTSRGLISVF
jgi:hypothetical protein